MMNILACLHVLAARYPKRDLNQLLDLAVKPLGYNSYTSGVSDYDLKEGLNELVNRSVLGEEELDDQIGTAAMADYEGKLL
jgi:hypothetical protein